MEMLAECQCATIVLLLCCLVLFSIVALSLVSKTLYCECKIGMSLIGPSASCRHAFIWLQNVRRTVHLILLQATGRC